MIKASLNDGDIQLPDESHVVHYVKPSFYSPTEGVDAHEFILRDNEIGLSVNWLECFGDRTKVEQLDEVRRLLRFRLTMSKNGCLAELNVGFTKKRLSDELDSLCFINKPLPATNDCEDDPSHSEIMGLPPKNSDRALILGEMIAECVEITHPTM